MIVYIMHHYICCNIRSPLPVLRSLHLSMNQQALFTSTPQGVATYLKTLPAIRERCSKVYDLAKQGKLEYFDYAPDKEDQVAEFCVSIIKVGQYLYFLTTAP